METINVPKRKEGRARKRVRVVVVLYRDSQKYIVVPTYIVWSSFHQRQLRFDDDEKKRGNTTQQTHTRNKENIPQ